MTQEEIAARLGVSVLTVHHIERRALAKLRRSLRKRGVTFRDFGHLLDGDRISGIFKRN